MGGDGHNQPVPVGHQHHDPIPAQVRKSQLQFQSTFMYLRTHFFARRIQGMALLLAFVSSSSNSVKMDLPKAGTNQLLTRASFPLEVRLRLARAPIQCSLAARRAGSHGGAGCEFGRHDVRLCSN